MNAAKTILILSAALVVSALSNNSAVAEVKKPGTTVGLAQSKLQPTQGSGRFSQIKRGVIRLQNLAQVENSVHLVVQIEDSTTSFDYKFENLELKKGKEQTAIRAVDSEGEVQTDLELVETKVVPLCPMAIGVPCDKSPKSEWNVVLKQYENNQLTGELSLEGAVENVLNTTAQSPEQI